MNVTKKTVWGFICDNCGHDADSHGHAVCEKVIRTDYEDSSMGIFAPAKVKERFICGCRSLTLRRVKVSSTKEWE